MLQIFAIIDDTSVMNFRKKLQYSFPKNEGGGSMAVWNFSENSSVLEGECVPNLNVQIGLQHVFEVRELEELTKEWLDGKLVRG